MRVQVEEKWCHLWGSWLLAEHMDTENASDELLNVRMELITQKKLDVTKEKIEMLRDVTNKRIAMHKSQGTYVPPLLDKLLKQLVTWEKGIH